MRKQFCNLVPWPFVIMTKCPGVKVVVSLLRALIARGGGSSIVKVPRDLPPTRVYFFGPLVQPRVHLFGNFSRV